MTSVKAEEISGVTIGGTWIAKTEGQTDIQSVDEGVIVRQANGERTLYPWTQVDKVSLVPRI